MILLMMDIKTLMLLAVVAIIAVSCAKIFTKSHQNRNLALASYASVGVDEFQALIAEPVVQLLDVRSQEEFDDGHISGAVLVDVNDTAFVANALAVLDKQRPVAVYCRSGRRSSRAASLLVGEGFSVTNLDGGVIAWQDAGKSLVK